MFKFSKLLALAALAFMPSFSHAEAFHGIGNIFTLEQFAGNYASTSQSSGGSLTPSSSVSQYTYDDAGHGVVNFFSSSAFLGSVGSPLTVLSTNQGNVPLLTRQLTLTDPVHGAGYVITRDFPVPGAVTTADFVAIKRGNRVVEIFENVTGNSLGSTFFLDGTNIVYSVRQGR
ncbi:hypothetical protein [Candidatus Protochlamydia phocaeensis]|uniref:hypothetical protein n=1 Tax=Candidatus Protochlamydia phocaeensis TaxID=1414722 RepID=UPI000838D310|nr:hypothetical protein [Candidatus Protochlamydia phocaeensis]